MNCALHTEYCMSVLLDPRPWQKGSYKSGSVCPAFCPSVRKFFLGSAHYFFLELSRVLGAHEVLCMTEPDFSGKKYFCPKNMESGPKIGFFEYIGKSIH